LVLALKLHPKAELKSYAIQYMFYEGRGDAMAKAQVTVRLDENLLVRARKALGTDTVTETIEQALALVIEKTVHNGIIQKYGGVGGKAAFANR
jgi:hypothetical protein